VEELGAHTAVLVIDVQRGLFEEPTPVCQADTVLRNINTLVDRAHAAGVSVFWVQHSTKTTLIEETDAWQLHPALRPLTTDHFVRKHRGNAFQDTSLKGDLDALRVGKVVVAGLVSDGCVQATCKGARALGYDVVLVRDAHSTDSPDAAHVIEHWNEKLSRGIVRLADTADVDLEVSPKRVGREDQMVNDPGVQKLLEGYMPAVQTIAHGLRGLVLEIAPDTIEQVDTAAKMLAYGFARTYKDMICVIMPLKAGVNLGFPHGASMSDRAGLLTGTGKRARHVRVTSLDQVATPAVRELIELAVDLARQQRSDTRRGVSSGGIEQGG